MKYRLTAIFKRSLSIASLLWMISVAAHMSAQNYAFNPLGLDAVKTVKVMKSPQSDLLMLVAHRGDHAMYNLAATGVPENSIEAIRRAAAAGLEIVEVDIRTTSDGSPVPILSHDETWGRETNYCSPARVDFDPLIPLKKTASSAAIAANEACNPKVNSLSLSQVQTSGMTLRDSVNYTVSGEQPSTLQQVLDYFKENQIGMVLALDIKSPADAKACWQVIQANTDYLGRSSAESTVFRIGAGAYQTPADFKSAFGDNYSQVNYWPTYGTSVWAAPPAGFGSETAAIQSLSLFENDATISMVAAEVQIKEAGGILSNLISIAQSNPVSATGTPLSVTEFNPLTEWTDPNNPSAAQFYGTAGTYRGASSDDPLAGTPLGGHCCITLDYYLYQGTDGQPSDYSDNRTNLTFILSNKPNIITTDDAVNLSSKLAGEGLRNLTHIQRTGWDPHCNGGAGQYPECDNNGQTTYTLCAAEGETCIFTGDRNLFFGANGVYSLPFTFTNSVQCNASSFGGNDPIPSVAKSCYYGPPISYYPTTSNAFYSPIYCADEGQSCNWTEPVAGSFGVISAHGNYSADDTASGNHTPPGYQCANSTFPNGDPAPNFKKACFYVVHEQYALFHTGPAGYSFCASELNSGACAFKGRGRIAFGRSGSFNYGVFSDGVSCDTAHFGDPIPNYTKDCWYQTTTAVNSVTGTGGSGSGGGTGSGTGPCDLYASGGTPCVAAHSMVRALFSSYSGRLYQVTRASDASAQDISTLAAGGYANAASQDTFCASTTCTITMIYDQTRFHNDLPVTAGSPIPVR
jgi:glycerophosphoryl diester phosphodiesterase